MDTTDIQANKAQFSNTVNGVLSEALAKLPPHRGVRWPGAARVLRRDRPEDVQVLTAAAAEALESVPSSVWAASPVGEPAHMAQWLGASLALRLDPQRWFVDALFELAGACSGVEVSAVHLAVSGPNLEVAVPSRSAIPFGERRGGTLSLTYQATADEAYLTCEALTARTLLASAWDDTGPADFKSVVRSRLFAFALEDAGWSAALSSCVVRVGVAALAAALDGAVSNLARQLESLALMPMPLRAAQSFHDTALLGSKFSEVVAVALVHDLTLRAVAHERGLSGVAAERFMASMEELIGTEMSSDDLAAIAELVDPERM